MGKTVICKINHGQFNPDFLKGDKVVNLLPNKFMPKVFRFKGLEMYGYILEIELLLYILSENETNQCLTWLSLYLEGCTITRQFHLHR